MSERDLTPSEQLALHRALHKSAKRLHPLSDTDRATLLHAAELLEACEKSVRMLVGKEFQDSTAFADLIAAAKALREMASAAQG